MLLIEEEFNGASSQEAEEKWKQNDGVEVGEFLHLSCEDILELCGYSILEGTYMYSV